MLLQFWRTTRCQPPTLSYPDSAISLEQTGSPRPYLPTYFFSGRHIDTSHHFFERCPRFQGLIDIGITGWLLPEDALKIYELAYFSSGNVLELGCYHGLSTYVLALAIKHSPQKKEFLSVDLSQEFISIAQKNIQTRECDQCVTFVCDDATAHCRRLQKQGKKFSFVFVDHSHTYEAVASVCNTLPFIVSPGGFCLFHDYNNPWNKDPERTDYGVWQAVHDHLQDDTFSFSGVFGCCGLFQRKK